MTNQKMTALFKLSSESPFQTSDLALSDSKEWQRKESNKCRLHRGHSSACLMGHHAAPPALYSGECQFPVLCEPPEEAPITNSQIRGKS